MTNLMNQFIDSQSSRLQHILADNLKLTKTSQPLVPLVFVGSGSSLNAALACQPYFERFTGNPLEYMTPLAYMETNRFIEPQILIAISQTGSSIATIEALRKAHEAQHHTILLTANQDFSDREEIDDLIDLMCADEQIGPKTIGFTATVTRLLQLSWHMGIEQGELTREEAQSFSQALSAEITEMPQVKHATLDWLKTHQNWQAMPYGTVTSSSGLKGIAAEGALKLLETLRVPVMDYEIGEFTHGPHRLMKKGSYHLFIVTEADKELSFKVKAYAEKIGAHVLCLSPSPELSDIVLGAERGHQALLISVVFQVLANQLALGTGFNPDQKVHPDFFSFVGTKN